MSIRRLRKLIDSSLVKRMLAGWKPSGRTLSEISGGRFEGRPAETYRAARRNDCKTIRAIWGEQWHYK